MIDRGLRALGVAVFLSSCAEGPFTWQDVHVRQGVEYRKYGVRPRLDVILVVNTGNTIVGETLRERVSRSLQERARSIAEGEGALRHLWNPVDIRAVVADGGGVVRSPRDVAALAWREPNATLLGAATFGAAVEEAIRAASMNEARKAGVVTALREALATAATPTEAARLIVVLTTEDDANLPDSPLRDPRLHGQRRDETAVVLPDTPDSGGRFSAPKLENWARANDVSIERPSEGAFFDASEGARTSCLDWNRSPRQGARCRVRALVPPGTACDAERGWRAPASRLPPPFDDELVGMSSCEVVALEGDDLRVCQSDSGPADHDGVSGWCAESSLFACTRLVGGAAPPWATIEVACNFDE